MTPRTISPATYWIAYAALIALTFATVGLSFARLSPWHFAVGAAFAVVKTAIVALIFMGLIRSPARTWLTAGVGLFWLGILMILTVSDYLTRFHAAY
jgi:cytochrome c oxidase subunit 4